MRRSIDLRSGHATSTGAGAVTSILRCALLVPALLIASMAAGQEPAIPARDDAAFRIIGERNIFNPNRSPGRATTQTRTERAPKRVESFALVGTMSYEKGRFAFFDGSDAGFRKALSAGQTIAGHTVQEISPEGVKLERDGTVIELKVKEQLRREEDGPWEVSGTFQASDDRSRRSSRGSTRSSGDSSRSGSSSSSTAERAPAAAASTAESDADAADVLKRLMQQREKELK